MLVVTRKKDERLIIGNEIEIQVLRIGRDNVRLGIKAPSHISIYRYEIYEAIRNEDVSAVRSQIPDKAMLAEIAGNLRTETARPETNGPEKNGESARNSEADAHNSGNSHDDRNSHDAAADRKEAPNGSNSSAAGNDSATTAPRYKSDPKIG